MNALQIIQRQMVAEKTMFNENMKKVPPLRKKFHISAGGIGLAAAIFMGVSIVTKSLFILLPAALLLSIAFVHFMYRHDKMMEAIREANTSIIRFRCLDKIQQPIANIVLQDLIKGIAREGATHIN